MKGLILTLAEDDPDLASRIVTSAKKATLYKNFALDNYEQACMNPHNYGSSGRLNVYQHPHSWSLIIYFVVSTLIKIILYPGYNKLRNRNESSKDTSISKLLQT